MSDLIGRLRGVFTLLLPAETTGEAGERILTWNPAGTVRAAVGRSDRSTRAAPPAEASVDETILNLRWRPDLVAGARLVRSADVFEIVRAIDQSGEQRWLECRCRRIVP